MKKEYKCPACNQKLHGDEFEASLDLGKLYTRKCNNHIFSCCVIEKEKPLIIYEQLEIKLDEEKMIEARNILGQGLRGVFPYSITITNYLYQNYGSSAKPSTCIFRGLTHKFNDTLTIYDLRAFNLDFEYQLKNTKKFNLLDFNFSNLEETLQRAETYYMLS